MMNTDINVAGSEVGAGKDGKDLVGPMNKGGLVEPRAKAKAKTPKGKRGLGKK